MMQEVLRVGNLANFRDKIRSHCFLYLIMKKMNNGFHQCEQEKMVCDKFEDKGLTCADQKILYETLKSVFSN